MNWFTKLSRFHESVQCNIDANDGLTLVIKGKTYHYQLANPTIADHYFQSVRHLLAAPPENAGQQLYIIIQQLKPFLVRN